MANFLVTHIIDEGYDGGTLAEEAADGSGLSLREAIALANLDAAADVIEFAAGLSGTITLANQGSQSASRLLVTSDLTIDGDTNGDEVADITISGNDLFQIFSLHGVGTDVDLRSLTLAHGKGFPSGGAIYVDNDGVSLNILNTTIRNSHASPDGGAIAVIAANLNLVNSTLIDNSAFGFGGAIYGSSSTISLTNTTVDGNSANNQGGGILINGGTLTVNNSTITRNQAGLIDLDTNEGGGVADAGTFVVNNSVIAGNTSGISMTPDELFGIALATNSFFETSVTLDPGSTGNINGGGDPLLGPLFDNGGAVPTRSPLDYSPLSNAGSNAVLGLDTFDLDGDNNVAESLPRDARGGVRIFATAVDIGAVEWVPDETITGTAGDDIMLGGSGHDVLRGLSGNDLLVGGIGTNTLIGGADDDIYVIVNPADVIVEEIGEGIDQVNSIASFVLPSNVENLSIVGSGVYINGTGNELNNILIGNDGNNVLDGMGGADNMIGGLGNDRFIVDDPGDIVSDPVNGGTDQVDSYISFVLFSNLEILVLLGFANINGVGNEGRNIIYGNAGNNTLDGLGGGDYMLGGDGDDIYVVADIGDLVSESSGPNGGVDQVNAYTHFILPPYVENLTLLGDTGLVGTGNEMDNVLIGGAGVDRLDGRGGADIMVGGLGSDAYVVDDPGDIVSEEINGGLDHVYSSVRFTLFANLENLTLTGDLDINGIGNELDNRITGSTGNNIITGNAGSDHLIGNGGNDTYFFGDGSGDDIITDFSAGVGVGDVINLVPFGFADFTALLAATDDSGGSGPAVIQLDADDTLTLQGVTKAQLDQDDFVLV